MMDAAIVAGDTPFVSIDEKRAKTLRRFRLSDLTFRWLTQIAAVTVLALLVGVMLALLHGSLPAWRAFGLEFLTSQSWNPVKAHFGALPAIYGTLLTSFLAMLIGVPVSIGIAIFLTEICPEKLRRTIGVAIELLAGIPSIIYGIWGLFVFAPWFQATVQPFLIEMFAGVPVMNQLFAGPPYGIGLLTAGLILAVMVLPFITSVTREVFETVPLVLKEAAYGIGCTRWEVVRRVVIPYTRVGIIGGVMLGLGRALGETMAVTFVIGNTNLLNNISLFSPGNSITSALANEFTEAVGDLYTASLIALGLILFFITFIVLAAARLMLMRIARKAGA
jgi:phosphate transport system permease protein